MWVVRVDVGREVCNTRGVEDRGEAGDCAGCVRGSAVGGSGCRAFIQNRGYMSTRTDTRTVTRRGTLRPPWPGALTKGLGM